MSRPSDPSQPQRIDEFVQSLVRQLDDVQDALALKIRAGRPLSWALKDVSLDLQVFVASKSDGTVTIRSAAPNEQGSSTLHLELTTIGREHLEENAWDPGSESDGRSIRAFGESVGLRKETVHRLERLGLRTVGQLHRAVESSSEAWVSDRAEVPSDDLRKVMRAARRPDIRSVEVEPFHDGLPLVRLLGVHLSDGRNPEVLICNEPVEVLFASPNEVQVRPAPHHRSGQVELRHGEERATGWVQLPQTTPHPWGHQ